MMCIEVPGFSLDDTFRSKQCFSWTRRYSPVSDSFSYFVKSGKKLVRMFQSGKNRLCISGKEDEFFDYWFNYLDLSYDYTQIPRMSSKFPMPVHENVDRSHLLKLEPMDAILSNLVWDHCNSFEAKKRYNLVCLECCGEKVKNFPNAGSFRWYPTPTPEELAEHIPQLRRLFSGQLGVKLARISSYLCLSPELLDPSIDPEEAVMLLMESGSMSERQARRIARSCYGLDDMCIPKKYENKVIRHSWGIDLEEVSSIDMEQLEGHLALVGIWFQKGCE